LDGDFDVVEVGQQFGGKGGDRIVDEAIETHGASRPVALDGTSPPVGIRSAVASVAIVHAAEPTPTPFVDESQHRVGVRRLPKKTVRIDGHVPRRTSTWRMTPM